MSFPVKSLSSAFTAVAGFSFGTAAATLLVASGEQQTLLLPAVTAAASALVLLGWLLLSRGDPARHPPRLRALVVSGLLNAILAIFGSYLWLGTRAQDLLLSSRWEAARSVLGPRFLAPAGVFLRPVSFTPLTGYTPTCQSRGLRPEYIGLETILEPYDVLDATLARGTGPGHDVLVKVQLRNRGLDRLRRYSRVHLGEEIGFVFNDILLESFVIQTPIEASPLTISGAGLSPFSAKRLVFWLRRGKQNAT